jgi:hypothetical protein
MHNLVKVQKVRTPAVRNADSGDCAREVSEGKKEPTGNWTKAICVTVWQRTCLYFFLCPEALWEADFKSDGLINLTENFKTVQHSVYSMNVASCF